MPPVKELHVTELKVYLKFIFFELKLYTTNSHIYRIHSTEEKDRLTALYPTFSFSNFCFTFRFFVYLFAGLAAIEFKIESCVSPCSSLIVNGPPEAYV